MFNNFTSSDEHERDRITFRRLCTLRRARRAGYFDEPVLARGEWPGEPDLRVQLGLRKSDDEYDEWLAQQPGLGRVIDRLKAANQWWDYESDEGFRGRRV